MLKLALALLAVTLSTSAFAAEKINYSSTSSTAGGTAVGVADTDNVSFGKSLSVMFGMGNNWLQTYLTVPQTRGSFVFSLGGIYKFTVAGDRKTGFHVGPGIAIGTVSLPSGTVTTTGTGTTATVTTNSKSKFAFSLSGLAGGHFTIFDRLMLSVDAGPILKVVDGDSDFSMEPMGGLLGLGVHYLF